MDRRYLIKDKTIEVIDKGESRGTRSLDPSQAARIDELAASAASADVKPTEPLPSDRMETQIDIRGDADTKRLQVGSGDDAPPAVWELIGEVSRASGG